MKHLIKNILREETYWQTSDDDKWNSLEKDLRYVVERLIDFCNREDRKTKIVIFRVIRCHNCSQASTGGSKIGIKLALPSHHIEWMTKVRMGCAHSSVDKTMRILLEWYIRNILVV
jgi:hypothetical protein